MPPYAQETLVSDFNPNSPPNVFEGPFMAGNLIVHEVASYESSGQSNPDPGTETIPDDFTDNSIDEQPTVINEPVRAFVAISEVIQTEPKTIEVNRRLNPANLIGRRREQTPWWQRVATIAAIAGSMALTACESSNSLPAVSSSNCTVACVQKPAVQESASSSVAGQKTNKLKLGVYEPENSNSYKQVKKSGLKPKIVIYYGSLGEPFQTNFAETAHKNGAEVFAEIQPDQWSPNDAESEMKDFASGADDTYLSSFAAEVDAFKHPVELTFGHEPNGNWYNWGFNHVKSKTWIAAYRHFVSYISHRAPNASFVWAMNVVGGNNTINPDKYWPGHKYAKTIGLDGYVNNNQTVGSVFDKAVQDVRKLTNNPIEISETGVNSKNSSQTKLIISEIKYAFRNNMKAILYFNKNKDGQDWKLIPRAASEVKEECPNGYCK